MSLFGTLYAAAYDRGSARIDDRGGREHWRRVVHEAEGEVLEIGAGTGANFPLYRVASGVVALEPDPDMRARADRAPERLSFRSRWPSTGGGTAWWSTTWIGSP